MSTLVVAAFPVDAIVVLCQRYGVQELAVFGSVLRDDFDDESDVDFLVVFENNDYGPWISKLAEMEDDLSALLGRRVDLVSKRAIEQSENYIRRQHVLSTARTLYVA